MKPFLQRIFLLLLSFLLNSSFAQNNYLKAIQDATKPQFIFNQTIEVKEVGAYAFASEMLNATQELEKQFSDFTELPNQGNILLTAPNAVADSYTVDEDNTLTVTNPGGLLDNDFDVDGDNLTVNTTPISAPASGSLTLNTDGSFSYIPDANANGIVTFEYEVCDDDAVQECSSALVTITIVAVNDAPIPIADIANPDIIEDTPYVGTTLLANDTDSDVGDLLSVNPTAVIAASHGALVLNSDGTYSYTPASNYFGPDTFSYEVCDNGIPQLCATASVSLFVTAVPDAPATVTDNYSTNEDVSLNASSVLANDVELDGETLLINTSPISPPTNGLLTINGDGSFSYIPANNYTGPDSFVYEVCDNGAPIQCSQGTVSINVSPLNDSPIATDDIASTNEDSPLNGLSVLLNDVDPDSDPMLVNTIPVTNVTHGSLTLNSDGTYLYTPTANYHGPDFFVYSVCDNQFPAGCSNGMVNITVNPLNDAPLANNDVNSTNEDILLNGATVLSNDSDSDGDLLVVNTTPITPPLHGILVLNSNGTYSYNPSLNYNGPDSFVYEVCDNAAVPLCSNATVNLTITAVADAPIATNDNYSINEDALLNGISVLTNDSDGDGDALNVSTTPITGVTNGTLFLNSDGTFTYIPNSNFNGTDSFVYEVCDGSSPCASAIVTITVNPLNDAPNASNDVSNVNEDAVLNGISVLNNDSDIEGNLLSVNTSPLVNPSNGSLLLNANGTYTYTPNANFNGTDSFVYEVCDNGVPISCSNATVTITVTSLNDAPNASNDIASTNEDTPLLGSSLIANDSDIDGNSLSISTIPVTPPTNGILVINTNGTYTYTPNLSFNGTDSFVYSVCDNGSPSLCSNATVTITVNALNDLPQASNDAAFATEDNPLNGASVLSNDIDPDGNPLTVSTIPVVAPLNGTVSLNSNGTYLYTPNANFNGSDSFVYEVCDNAFPVGCATATVTITISAVNDNPIANANSYSTNEDNVLNGSTVITNDLDVDGNPLLVSTSPVVTPTNGSLTLNSNGTFTYTPNLNFSGIDSFIYQVCDNGTPSLCATALVTITVNPTNDPPIAVNGTYSTSEDVTLNATSVLANDSDPDGDLLTVNTTPLVNVSSGTLTLNSNGTFSYVPALNFNGVVSFVYQVCDNGTPSLCSSATTTINVISVNDGPSAVNDSYTTNEDSPLNGTTVLSNDSDLEGNTITLNTTPITAPINGTLLLNANGSFTYTPFSNYNGSDSFVYQICDNGSPSLCSNATVTLTITSINDAPAALSDNGTTLENITLFGTTVLANDSDPENGTLTVNTVPVTNVLNGTLTLNSNGTYTYVPNFNYNGFDFFVYQVCDNGTPVGCSTATVTISIGAVNQFPIALNDAFTTNEDTPNNGNVLSNDSDPDLDVISVTAQTNFPTLHGSITIAANGVFTYTPILNYNGPDSFIYQVCDNGSPSLCSNGTITITVVPINDAPVAVNDNVTTPEDTPLLGSSLLNNDSDVDGNPLTVTLTPIVAPTHGALTINANGTFLYTPNLNYVGGDIFVYEACDNALPPICSNAVVQLTITQVNDAPSANNDTYITNEDVVLNGTSVLLNDFDQDGNSLQVSGIPVVPPSNGSLLLNANGTFIYTPAANFNGTDSFVYQVCDNAASSLCTNGTVSITINAINDAPIALANSAITSEDTPLNGTSVLVNDSDPDGNPIVLNTTPAIAPLNGTVIINANGTYTYTPNLNYNGADSFTYQICDNGTPALCATAVVTISISSINDAPLAGNDIAVTNEDTPLNGTTVLSNDNDPDGNPLLVSTTPITAPLHGTLTLNANGTYSYIPTANYNGPDSFVYQVCDNVIPALCTTATVNITINAINDAPVTTNDAYTTAEDNPLIGGNLLLNDTDPEAGILVITTLPVSLPSNGTLVLNANGTFLYTPNLNFNGTDSFVYRVCDAGIPVACATGLVTITITAVNDAPIALDNNASTLEDIPLNGSNLLTNDTDPDGNLLSINTTAVTNPTNGTVVINSNGTYLYTPNLGYTGFDSFVYQVCDNGSPILCDNATVTIGIGAVNHAPLAVNDAFTTNENTTLSNTLATNDSDPDGDNLIFSNSLIVLPTNGSVTLSANGTFSYIPNPGFNGSDNFTYQVCDNGTPSLCATATATITVNSINDKPLANKDFFVATEDVTLNGTSLLANDSDPDGNTLTISTTPVNAPINGNVTINSNGTFTYTPNLNFSGTDSFVYQACDNGTPSLCDTAIVLLVITSVNDAPIALNDNAATLTNTPVSGNVLTNDSDVDNPTLTVSLLNTVTNGTLVLNPNGTFNYTPNSGFTGNDTFTYIACDNGSPVSCDTATVLIQVSVIPNSEPIALKDIYNVNEDLTLIASNSVLSNDSDPNTNAIILNTTPVVQPTNGLLTLNSNGTFTYIPNTNFTGLDTFVYQICDDGSPSLCDTALVLINVNPINDAPIAINDTFITLINTSVSGNVLLNDTDPDGPSSIASQLTLPINGSLSFNSTGGFTYSPSAGFTGTDSFTYSVCDGGTPSLCSNATVFITINPLPPNQAPIANGDFISLLEDAQISGNISSNDSDPEASTLIYTAYSGPTQNGTIALSASGNFIYSPAANYFGQDSFIYTVCDTASPPLCDTAIINITITSVNDAPIAKNDTSNILQGAVASGNLLLNDTDVESVILTSSLLVAPINGLASVNANGSFTYTPNVNFVGTDIFSYTSCDGGSPNLCDTALVVVNVTAPLCAGYMANSDNASTSEEVPVIINQLANDNVIISNLLVSIVTNPLNGTAILNPNNSITYIPNLDFNGTDTLVYAVGRTSGPAICDTALVIIAISSVNDSPIAINDSYTTLLGNSVSGNVITNDSDVDGPSIGATLLLSTSNGTLIFNPNGTFTYTPNAGFLGADIFSYILCDGGLPNLCDTAVATIFVNGQICAGYKAQPDTASLNEDGVVTIDVLLNDTVNIVNVGITVPVNPLHGTVSMSANHIFTYTPDNNYFGTDSFIYGVLDSTLPNPPLCDTAIVWIVINKVNDAPVANSDFFPTNEGQTLFTSVLLNDSDVESDSLFTTLQVAPQNGVLILNSDGSFTYTPNSTFIGIDSFIYQLCDNGIPQLCDTALVRITVLKINKSPFAADDTASVNQGESATGNVLINDIDPDLNDLLFVSLVTQAPVHGSINMSTDGNFTYTANDVFFGVDSFAYEVCDDNFQNKKCDVALVRITVVETPITVPNAFSPDGDNINDLFVIKRIQTFPNNELKVFNRWGHLVYSKKGYDNSWDGKASVGSVGDGLPSGSYYYVINFNDGITEAKQGYIVIRK